MSGYTHFSLNKKKLRRLMIDIAKMIIPVIKEGEMANLTVFDPKATWRYNTTESRSANSPFVGKEMKGKILGVVNLDRTIRR